MKLPKYLQLITDASSTKKIHYRDSSGNWTSKGVAQAAVHALCRPPFIVSAPTEKRKWSKKEIDEFYKNNPLLKI